MTSDRRISNPGGAQGIGYGIAEHLASQGAHVVLLDMNDTVLQTGEPGRMSISATVARQSTPLSTQPWPS